MRRLLEDEAEKERGILKTEMETAVEMPIVHREVDVGLPSPRGNGSSSP